MHQADIRTTHQERPRERERGRNKTKNRNRNKETETETTRKRIYRDQKTAEAEKREIRKEGGRRRERETPSESQT
jgi:hypothetical protein